MTGLFDFDESGSVERRSHVCYECGKVFDDDMPEWMAIRCGQCQKKLRRPRIVADDPDYKHHNIKD